jgi:energy-coupling factor transport system substrate-specific component
MTTAVAPRPVLQLRWAPALTLLAASAVGVAAFGWPFLLGNGSVLQHQSDAPWLFVLLVALLGAVVAAELSSGGMDAKTVALLGVLAAVGGALRVLGAGTAGLEPMFFLLVLAGRVIGPAAGFLLGGLAVLVGGFLTGGIGPWTPFQMFAAGWVTLGAALLPPATGRAERWLLAAYGFGAGLAFGIVMNMWFWPFLTAVPDGASFVSGDPVADNLSRYAVFYVATSLGWDLPRAFLTAGLCLLAGRPVLLTLRRGIRRASFGVPPPASPPPPR